MLSQKGSKYRLSGILELHSMAVLRYDILSEVATSEPMLVMVPMVSFKLVNCITRNGKNANNKFNAIPYSL